MHFCSVEFWLRAGLLPAYKALYYISLSSSTQCHAAVFILKVLLPSLFFPSVFLFSKTTTVYHSTSAVWLYFSTALTTTSEYKKDEL